MAPVLAVHDAEQRPFVVIVVANLNSPDFPTLAGVKYHALSRDCQGDSREYPLLGLLQVVFDLANMARQQSPIRALNLLASSAVRSGK